jgi:glutathione S-transferase
MPDLTLYHAAPSRSSIVLWMLEELGRPYDIKLIKLSAGDNLRPDYLAITPMGKVPALKHGDTVITEAAAICTYLADEFPGAKLNIPVGTPRRGIYLKWLFFGPSCIEPAVIDRAAPRKEEARHARLWRFRHYDECGRAGGGEGAVADGRAIHRRRPDRRREYPLGHDVQDDSAAAGISRLRRAHRGASGGPARRGQR